MNNRLDADLWELSFAAKCAFLARMAHAQTIHARNAYIPDTEEADGRQLRKCNEFLHRLTGCLRAVAERRNGDQPWDHAMSIISSHYTGHPDTLAELKTWLREAAVRVSD